MVNIYFIKRPKICIGIKGMELNIEEPTDRATEFFVWVPSYPRSELWHVCKEIFIRETY